MRRRPGRLNNATKYKERYKEYADEMAAVQINQLRAQLEMFRTNLEEYARKHKKEIRKDPVFRQHFQRMCQEVGVDPLASNKGFWAELLGVGDFYYELSVQIIEICLATRPMNGGLIEMGDLKHRVEKIRGGAKEKAQEITEDDIARSIKTLKPLGNGFDIMQIGDRKMVRSVPKELNIDQSTVLVLAQKNGFVTRPMIIQLHNWLPGRIDHALENLLQDGLCWIDKQADPEEYWVASYFSGDD